jgi:Flp pilus assembly protein TadG
MNRRNRRGGNTLIEFAASLIVLSTMFAGIFQVGYSFYTYSTLVNAVRAGARYASLRAPANAADKDFDKAVRNVVVYGESTPVSGALPIVNGLTADNVEMTLGPTAATVSLRNFAIDAMFTKLKLDGRPTVTFPLNHGAAQ